jgi:hypothetical protein
VRGVLRARLREVKRERDELRRQLQGAQGRIAALERQLAEAAAARVVEQDRLADRQRALEDSDRERDRAVERERRRRDAEIARLEDRITALRRAEQQRHETRRAAEEGRRAADLAAQRAEVARRREEEDARAPTRLVPGRPSQLPRGVQAGTTEAAELLLHPGRSVFVDGYNVTKRRHPDWDLERQRTWLVQQLATLAMRRRVRPVAVFDGQRGGRHRPAAGVREVEVRFTPAGITADDELVLAAEATDEPIVVVTDDRELTDRLRPSHVDVVGTQEFLWVLR